MSLRRTTIDLDVLDDCAASQILNLDSPKSVECAFIADQAGQVEAANDLVSVLTTWMASELKASLNNVEEKLDILMLEGASSQLMPPPSPSRKKSHRLQAPVSKIRSGSHTSSPRSRRDSSGISALKEDEPSSQKSALCATTSCTSPTSPNSYGMSLPVSFQLNRGRARMSKMVHLQGAIEKEKNPRGQLAAEIWRFFENRYSSLFARIYAALATLFVVSSVLLSFWQSIDGCPFDSASGEIMQTMFESLFALELIIRCIVCPDRWHFLRDTFNIIDFCSASPIFFRIIIYLRTLDGSVNASEKELQSVVAMVPVLRLLKLTRRFEKFQILLSAVLIALEALPVLLYSLVVIALLFSALFFAAEPKDNVKDMPQALWFILVTMTTVGYGDITPLTTVGHVITVCLMLISGLFLAMPIGIVGNAFSEAWCARDRLLLMHRMREAFTQEGFSAKSLQTIVKMFDMDGDGALSDWEFTEMLETMSIHISPERVQLLFEELNLDGSGKVTVSDLMSGLFPNDYRAMFVGLRQATESALEKQRANALDKSAAPSLVRSQTPKPLESENAGLSSHEFALKANTKKNRVAIAAS